MQCFLALTLLIASLSFVHSAKILALFPLCARSHYAMFSPLLRELAQRGHQVTVASHFPPEKSIANFTYIDIRGSMHDYTNDLSFEWFLEMNFVETVTFNWFDNEDVCVHVLGHPEIQKLLHSEEKFDLIINEVFSTDCFLGFVHKFQVPFVGMTSSVTLPYANERVGNPDNPAYIPNYFLPFSDRMSFFDRFVNTVVGLAINTAYYHIAEKPSYEMAKKHFGDDLPPLHEIAKNTSIILVNSHFSLNLPRPFVPAVVEVGGLHVREPKKLPKDLQAFMDESKDGVILFSFGSMVNCATLPIEKINTFLEVFSKMKQRVLWKTENIAGLATVPVPDNVKIVSWLPQVDVLSHPNVRVFLTHGGLMGTQEAVYAGVPMLGVPFFGDQRLNMQKYVAEGFAVLLEFRDITSNSLRTALDTIINDHSYKENVARISKVFRDRPQTPLETAIFWVEYVIRHDGAYHLRSAATELPLYQYLLLDVLAILLLGLVVILAVLVKLGMIVSSCFRSSREKQNEATAKKAR